MRNENIKVGELVPEEVRLQIYKEVLEIIDDYGDFKISAKNFGLTSPCLCLLLPCVLWDLSDYHRDHPSGKAWCFDEDSPAMFPELTEWLEEYNSESIFPIPIRRIEFLERTIKNLENEINKD